MMEEMDTVSLEIDMNRNDDKIMRHGIAVMIAEMHANGYNGRESKKYHGLLIYNVGGVDADVDEEPLLCWIVATTQ